MLDFLLQLKSMCFILASAHKSLFFFSLKHFMNVFRSCPIPSESQFFPPGSHFSPHCILAALSVLPEVGAGGSSRGLVHTSVIFVFQKQCNIVDLYSVWDSLITSFISTVPCPVFEPIVVLTYVSTFHLFLLNLASFFLTTSLICHNFSDSCSII